MDTYFSIALDFDTLPGCVTVENNSVAGNTSTVDRLKRRIVLLEGRGQQLKSEKEHLQVESYSTLNSKGIKTQRLISYFQAVYQRQCSQQVHLVQHLVGKMQQLRDIGNVSGTTPPPFDPEALQRLDTLTTEILQEVVRNALAPKQNKCLKPHLSFRPRLWKIP